jgi:hypothetical protein
MPVLLLAGAVQAPAPPSSAATTAAAVSTRAGLLLRAEPAPAQPDAPAAAAPAAAPAVGPVGPGVRRASRDTERVPAASGPAARGRAALAALDYDWRALGYRVVFAGYTGGELGSANRRTRTITIRVRPSQSELSLRTTIAHELGHALDFEHGTSERRDAYRRIRGLPGGTPWFPCSGCDDFRSPAGDFAEVFATWLVGPGDFRSRLKGRPSEQDLRRLDGLLRLPARPAARPEPAAEPQPEPEPSEEPARGLTSLLEPTPPPRHG